MSTALVPTTAPPVPAFSMGDMEKIANAIARGGLFGSKDPYAVLTLCMIAQAEGQHPAVVMRDYDFIQGKPAKKAQAMLRDFLASGGRVEWHRLDAECADATFSHPAGGEFRNVWNMARAAKAQLGGKEMWKKFPQEMLRSRCISDGVRTVFPGATGGMYEPGEVADFANETPRAATPTATPVRREASKQIAAPEPEPNDHDPETGEIVDTPTEPTPDAIKWATATISQAAKAPDRAALAGLQQRRGDNLVAIREFFPDLAATVDAAFQFRWQSSTRLMGRQGND